MYSKFRVDEVLNEIVMKLSKGKMLAGDLEVLYEASKDKEIIVELGTSFGLGAMILSLNGGKVHTVDNYKIFEDEDFIIHKVDKSASDSLFETVSNYLLLFGKYKDNIKLIYSDTKSESKKWKDESIDLLYIDADHSAKGVKEDFGNWKGKVKIGGLILFHDYSEYFPEIVDFIDKKVKPLKNFQEIKCPTLGRTVIKIFERIK